MPFVTAPRLFLQPLAVAAGLLLAGVAQAQSLQELYDAARGYDATYLSTRAAADAAAARAAQAEALTRPTLGLGASGTVARSDPPTTGAINSTTLAANLQGKYSVYNAANAPTIDKARRAYALAQADLESAEQDLMVRLATASSRAMMACWRPESMVPPEMPPRIERTRRVVSPSSPAPSAAARSAVTSTPRSLGIESKPQACTIRASVSAARAATSSSDQRTNSTSPVRSA